jgi:hypothetical protein
VSKEKKLKEKEIGNCHENNDNGIVLHEKLLS